MTDDKQNLIGQLNAVKKALAARQAARLVRRGGSDDSQHRAQKD